MSALQHYGAEQRELVDRLLASMREAHCDCGDGSCACCVARYIDEGLVVAAAIALGRWGQK